MRKGQKMSLISRKKMSAHRKTMTGDKSANWKGGLQLRHGRVYVSLVGKRIQRYRWILENHLGRKLMPYEIIHHINGDKTDDRIENLIITTRSEHAKMHKLGKEIRRRQHGHPRSLPSSRSSSCKH